MPSPRFIAHVAVNQEDFEEAASLLNSALETLRELQDISWEAYVLSHLGEVMYLQGDLKAARKALKTAHRIHQRIEEEDYAMINLSYLALVEKELGGETDAWQHSCTVIEKAKRDWPDSECPPEVYYNHYLVARATRHWACARSALQQAGNILDARAHQIKDPGWRVSYRSGLRVHREIDAALATQPAPGRLRVSLSDRSVPAHRRPRSDEMVSVSWTVDAGEEDEALAQREGSVALRRRRILRLINEARAVGALPTVADLAGALEVSSRTIRTDLDTLRDQGYTVLTRGHRS